MAEIRSPHAEPPTGGIGTHNFEDGSEGTPPKTSPVSDAVADARGQGHFNGTLTISDNRVFLLAGGIRAEVLASDYVPEDEASFVRERGRAASIFRAYDGKSVNLRGEQHNGYILRASLSEKIVPAVFPLSRSARQSFEEIVSAIRKNEKLLRKDPDVISIRPGYRFTNGWITDEPAIVVTVLRKKDRAAIPASDLLPSTIDNLRVDVTAATPLEQLKHERASGAEAFAMAFPEMASAEADIALPGWESYLESGLAESEPSILEALSDITYQPPPGLRLDEVTDAMTVLCHVSPDAGWPTLSKFLDRTTERMTIAMYDFTSPHILRGLRSAMSHASGLLRLILGPREALPKPGDNDSTKADDLPERTIMRRLAYTLGNRFESAFASVGNPDGIFANSYHIKVAVRDGRAFWLSSGNWQSSNQPEIDPLGADASIPNILRTYNREWHVIVEHPGLARLFEKYIEWDYEQARSLETAREAFTLEMPDLFVPETIALEAEEAAFIPRYFAPARLHFTPNKPLRVQPLLTPDNYARHVLQLIESAQEKIYFQNQSIAFAKKNYSMFLDLINALLSKSKKGLDVRIILRGDFSPRSMLEALKGFGFDDSRIKFQRGCHTKGIIVDSSAVLVSSHNWTNSGTLFNRDAGLIFYEPRIARYYEEIFLYDWDNLARRVIPAEEAMPVLASSDGPTPPGYTRMSWYEYFEE